MKIIDSEFQMGQLVFLKTDIDQKARIVTAMMQRGDGSSMYACACGTEERWHYEFEISTEKDVLITTTNG